MLKEFKEFAMKGNLLDIAVGFVMGAAFGKVVTAFTQGIVSPLVGLLLGGVDEASGRALCPTSRRAASVERASAPPPTLQARGDPTALGACVRARYTLTH